MQITSFLKIALNPGFVRSFVVVMILWYNNCCKVSQSSCKVWKTRFWQKLQNVKFRKILNLLKITVTASFLWSFGIVAILRDIKAGVKLANPLLRAEYQDSAKVVKCEISQNTKFSENSPDCIVLLTNFDIIF